MRICRHFCFTALLLSFAACSEAAAPTTGAPAAGGASSAVPTPAPSDSLGPVDVVDLGSPSSETPSASPSTPAASEPQAVLNSAPPGQAALDPDATPSENFDLGGWKLTLPDLNETSGNAQEIDVERLNRGYEHDDWFFTDAQTGALVFRAPNQAATTENTSNVRSEFRQMLDPGSSTRGPDNNWALATHPDAEDFAAIGGRLSASLAVDHVSLSGNDEKFVAGAVVVGQIHGEGKTEPLKIYYRKLPNHSHGSLFWNYEIRPENEDERYDISFDVWGDHTLRRSDANPADGVPLGAWFSYTVEVEGKMMTLEFTRFDGAERSFVLNIADGHPDHALDRGYGDDWFYFRAGAYNQCSTQTEHPVWGAGCSNDGIDAGDYVQVRFFELRTSLLE